MGRILPCLFTYPFPFAKLETYNNIKNGRIESFVDEDIKRKKKYIHYCRYLSTYQRNVYILITEIDLSGSKNGNPFQYRQI